MEGTSHRNTLPIPPIKSLCLIKLFSFSNPEGSSGGNVEQIIDEDKVFSQDGEWCPALRGADHEAASCSCSLAWV